ncbi:MAG: hypothetical protein ACKVPY_00830 [Paracoccaceae bacterium]
MKLLAPERVVLNGVCQLEVDCGRALPDAEARWLFDFLRDLAAVGSRGGFAPSGARATAMTLERFGPSRQGVTADFDLSEIDRRFLFCLESALIAQGMEVPVQEIRLGDGSGRFQVIDDGLSGADASVFPELRQDLGFPYLADGTVTSRMRSTVVTLSESVNAALCDRLAEWVAPLFSLVEAGAFVMTLPYPAEARSFYSGVQQFEMDSLEIVVDRFEADDAAFEILANMLAAFRSSGFPILRVEQY